MTTTASSTPVFVVPRAPDPGMTALIQIGEQTGNGIVGPGDLPEGDVREYLSCVGPGQVEVTANDVDGEPILDLQLSARC